MSPEIFAGVGQPVEQSSERTIYAINCQPADGEPHDLAGGVMQCYHLFPGIDLAYTQFRAGRCRMRERAFSDVLEIAYCQAGRFECEYKHGFVTFLGEGDFAVSVLSPEQQPPSFPLGTYDGVTLIVDRALTGPCSCGIVEGVSIDWQALAEKFCSDTCCSVARAPAGLRHVFEEIWAVRAQPQPGYLRLKALECFFLLGDWLPAELSAAKYYSRSQIVKVKQLAEALTCDLDTHPPLAVLAAQYGMSLTALKDCFKAVYGKPIATFQREYRMQVAARWLVETELSVAEIAGRLGYENPNKFSSAFKRVIGETPSAYRRARR